MSEGALVTRTKESTTDKIRKYYLKGEDSVTLSEKQHEIRKNIYMAWNLLINYHSREQAMNAMMTMASNEQGCSRATAYRYVTDAMSIFGNVLQNQKEAEKYLIKEDLKRLQQRAIKAKDGALELAVIKQQIKIGGFDKDTDPKFNREKLEAQTYILKLHPSVQAAMDKMKEGGAFDFNTIGTEDIDFEEVPEEEEGEEYEAEE